MPALHNKEIKNTTKLKLFLTDFSLDPNFMINLFGDERKVQSERNKTLSPNKIKASYCISTELFN